LLRHKAPNPTYLWQLKTHPNPQERAERVVALALLLAHGDLHQTCVRCAVSVGPPFSAFLNTGTTPLCAVTYSILVDR